MMVHFYMAITESILASSITAVEAAKDKGRLQRIICCAEKSSQVKSSLLMKQISYDRRSLKVL